MMVFIKLLIFGQKEVNQVFFYTFMFIYFFLKGFLVWKYELRRDDDEPAPWTPEGKLVFNFL